MPDTTDPRLLLLAPGDSVFVLRGQIAAGETFMVNGAGVTLNIGLGLGHKIARVAVPAGGTVIKYGAPIGTASQPISLGEHVHLHNLRSAYTPTYTLKGARS